ncbi:recombinase RecT [Streptomyces sp. NPDC057403]|uniref:recombinase RecT n=1 Tax=Streptomyces sp. NPDC057403 TaxID=3346119 RepID=UPI0036B13AB1
MTVTTLPVAAPATAPAVRGGALSLAHMSPYEAWQFCESLAQTPLLPDAYRKQPASVLWAMEYGRALGLDVVTTITTIHVIKGKPTQSADLMLGRARTAGHRVRIKSERHRCEVRIQRHDDPDDETVIEWTLDDAVIAGLCTLRDGRPYSRDQKNQPQPWEKFPRAMLRARAIAECVRAACPEVLHGAIYTPEELGAVVDQEGNPVIVERADVPQMTTATVVQSTPNEPPAAPPRDYLAEAVETADAQQLAAIVAAAVEAGAPEHYLAALGDIRDAHTAPTVDDVRKLYDQRKTEGAPAEHLARLAHIGSTKPAGQQGSTSTPTGPTPHSVSDAVAAEGAITGPTPEAAAEAAAEAAENALRIAASRANLPNLDADFERVYGLPIAQATAAQLDAFRRQIEAAGGAQ